MSKSPQAADEAPRTAMSKAELAEEVQRRRSTQDLLRRAIPFLAFILLFAFFAATQGDRFMTTGNMQVILQQSAVLAIVAFGMTLVIVAGSIDLSVGSVVALAGMVAAIVSQDFGAVALLAAAGVGAVAGLVNGAVFAYARIPSFIVTLGMLQVARGLTILLSGGASQPMTRDGIMDVIGRPPWIIVVLIVVAVVMAMLFRWTLFGRQVMSVGGNERVAGLSGIPVRRTKTLVFVVSGLLAGIGGAVLASRAGAGSPTAGLAFELDVISAVVIGGTPLTGGVGRMTGTLLGAVIMAMLGNGLVLAGVGDAQQMIIRGVVLAAAVFVSLERAKIGVIK